MKIPQKTEAGLSYDLPTSLLNIYPDKTIIQKDTCTTMFIASLFTIAKTYMHLYSGIKNEILSLQQHGCN